MSRSCRAASVLAAALLTGFPAPTRADDPAPDAQQLIDGILARSDAVFSGWMTYRYTIGREGKETVHELNVRLAFSGASWVERYSFPGQPESAAVSHNGSSLAYIPTQQKDGRVTKLAKVRPAVPMRSESKAPVFAGSFWRLATKKYVEENRKSVVLKGPAEVNGVKAAVLEWGVPRADVYKAFGFSAPGIDSGGVLRLYVAPQLGHAMPRIDFLSKKEEVIVRYDSSDFVKTPSGIHFPQLCSERLFAYSKTHPGLRQYTIKDIEKINEPIPDSEFSVPIPIGTEVIDARSGKGSTRFILSDKEAPPVPGLESIVARDPPSFLARNRTTAIVLGLAAGALLVVAAAIVRRVRRRRAAPA